MIDYTYALMIEALVRRTFPEMEVHANEIDSDPYEEMNRIVHLWVNSNSSKRMAASEFLNLNEQVKGLKMSEFSENNIDAMEYYDLCCKVFE